MQPILLEQYRLLFLRAFERGEILSTSGFQTSDPAILEWHESLLKQKFLNSVILEDTQEINFHDHLHIERISPIKKEWIEITHTWDDLELSFQILCFQAGVQWNYKRPFCSFSAAIGEFNLRITLLHKTLSPKNQWKGFVRVIGKQGSAGFKIDECWQHWVQNKKNILIAGATKSGKTTFIKNLLAHIPEHEHLVILEDTHEILTAHKKTTYFINQAGTEDFAQEQLKQFCAHAMRISPDRLVLGEMRGPEVGPFLLLMNSGHRGLMSTIHANTAVDALHRAALLFSLYQKGNSITYDQSLKLVAKNIDYVFFLEDLQVKEVIKINGHDQGQIFFESIIPIT
jgi:type IV secretion system protein VirB11